jgi:hypothetical protein
MIAGRVPLLPPKQSESVLQKDKGPVSAGESPSYHVCQPGRDVSVVVARPQDALHSIRLAIGFARPVYLPVVSFLNELLPVMLMVDAINAS